MYYEKKLVFDFDGTVSLVFKDFDLKAVTKEMYEVLKNYTLDFSMQSDPFDCYSAISNSDLSQSVKNRLLLDMDSILVEAELKAVKNNNIVEGFLEFLKWAEENHIDVSIATNNSDTCVKSFLSLNSVNYNIPIVGRIATKPELMKPNPYMLEQIMRSCQYNKSEMVFIGDNPRDFACANNFGCDFIGMTPTEGKRLRLENAVKSAPIVNNFFELMRLLENS